MTLFGETLFSTFLFRSSQQLSIVSDPWRALNVTGMLLSELQRQWEALGIDISNLDCASVKNALVFVVL